MFYILRDVDDARDTRPDEWASNAIDIVQETTNEICVMNGKSIFLKVD